AVSNGVNLNEATDYLPQRLKNRYDPSSLTYEELVALELKAYELSRSLFHRHTRDDWLRVLANAGRSAMPVLSPQEGLCDPWLASDRAIVRTLDKAGRERRVVGEVYRFESNPSKIARDEVGAHVSRPTAGAGWTSRAAPQRRAVAELPSAPLAGLAVLDLG